MTRRFTASITWLVTSLIHSTDADPHLRYPNLGGLMIEEGANLYTANANRDRILDLVRAPRSTSVNVRTYVI